MLRCCYRGDGNGGTGDALNDDKLFLFGGVADQDLHHEAVNLRFRQRVGALGLDRILRRHHQEGFRHFVGFAGNRHLPFLHYLEQRALHFGRSAVDLVGQQQVGEHRPQVGGELTGLLVVHARADQVGRQQIRGELDALELAAQGLRQRLDGQCLGEAGDAFDQKVALRQHGYQHTLQKVVLPHHHALDFIEHAFHQGSNFARGFAGWVADVVHEGFPCLRWQVEWSAKAKTGQKV